MRQPPRILGVIVTVGFIVLPVVSTIAILAAAPSANQLRLVTLHGVIASCHACALVLAAILVGLRVPLPDSRVLWIAALIAALNSMPVVLFVLR